MRRSRRRRGGDRSEDGPRRGEVSRGLVARPTLGLAGCVPGAGPPTGLAGPPAARGRPGPLCVRGGRDPGRVRAVASQGPGARPARPEAGRREAPGTGTPGSTPPRGSRSAGLGPPYPPESGRELGKGEGPGGLQTRDERPRGEFVGGVDGRPGSRRAGGGFLAESLPRRGRTPESCAWRALPRQDGGPAFRPSRPGPGVRAASSGRERRLPPGLSRRRGQRRRKLLPRRRAVVSRVCDCACVFASVFSLLGGVCVVLIVSQADSRVIFVGGELQGSRGIRA